MQGRLINIRNKYTFFEWISTAWALLITKLFYRPARLIRRPLYIRGKKSISIGKGFTIGHSCRFDLEGHKKTLHIGKNCEIGDNVHIVAHESVKLGDNVLIASKVFISDTSHGNYSGVDGQDAPTVPPNEREFKTHPVEIGNNVWIGENVVILSGCTIGDGCIIGANSTVNRSIPSNCIAVGSPAKIMKQYDFADNCWKRYIHETQFYSEG